MVQVAGRGVVYVAERHATLCKYVIPLSLAIEKVPSWRRERERLLNIIIHQREQHIILQSSVDVTNF